MPFVKGQATAGAGRKGYQFEQAQLDKMRKILDKDLKLVERLQDAKEISATDEKKLAISQQRILKIFDKLHASKEKHEVTGLEAPIVLDKNKIRIAKDFEKELKKTL